MVTQMTDEEIEFQANDAIERQDYGVALQLLEPLARSDSIYASKALGWIYQYGPMGIANFDRSCKNYKKAIKLGDTEAKIDFGMLLISGGRLAEARTVLSSSQNKNDKRFLDALEILNICEKEASAANFIRKKEYKKAFIILDPQRSVDSEYTQLALGWLYETGKGGVTDSDQARSLYERAAEHGGADAYFRIGMLDLAQGSEEAARAAFHVSANLAHFPSMTKLGEMMVEGRGGARDLAAGIELLTAAADKGHIMAKIKIAEIAYNAEKNLIKRIHLKLKVFFIVKDAIKVAIKEPESGKLYEFD